MVSSLQQALAERGAFQQIEGMLPRGAIAPTLTRFVTAIHRLHT